jgi:hypothetical protein
MPLTNSWFYVDFDIQHHITLSAEASLNRIKISHILQTDIIVRSLRTYYCVSTSTSEICKELMILFILKIWDIMAFSDVLMVQKSLVSSGIQTR